MDRPGEDDLRIRGNELFQNARYGEAIEHYSRALGRAEGRVGEASRILINRSAAYAKLGLWNESLADAERSVSLGGATLRACYRKGVALRELGLLAESLEALELGASLDPSNERVASAVGEGRALVRDRARRDSFRRARTEEVLEARRRFEVNAEERLAAESLRREAEERARSQRRAGYERHRLRTEEHQSRAFREREAEEADRRRRRGEGDAGVRDDPYEVLGLPPEGCPPGQVRRQYLRLVSKCHPDKPGGSREAFEAVRHAYEELLGVGTTERG
ncbi:hypothetical protein HOP50_06g45000 [Chloropicon primus]|nr:hypothetical protein HOP50_06g45000 [Chloropicon primus]